MGESLIKQVTWAENTVELTRDELFRVERTGNYDEIARIAARLADELKTLATLREKAAALSGRDLAKSVAAQLMKMARGDRQSARAITSAEPLENEGAEHAVGPFN